MKKRNTLSWTRRTAAFGVGLALLGGMTLASAPAHAEEAPAPVSTETPTPAETTAPTQAPALPELPAGTVTITGEPIVGNTLTGTATGWPEGTTLDYEWGESFGESGGGIEGAFEASYTLTSNEVGGTMVLLVTGSLDGFTSTTVSEFMQTTVTQPLKPAARPIPALMLSWYLESFRETVQPQTSVGLPTGLLDPQKDYTTTFTWTRMSDSYVDVFVYSEPTLVGTFPVQNGSVQIPLSAALLSSLAPGTHTLLVTGQTTEGSQAVSVVVAASPANAASAAVVAPARTALAETGVSVGWPLTAAAGLLLLGAVLVVVRRRRAQA